MNITSSLTRALVGLTLTTVGLAQIASDDFNAGNANGWAPDFTLPVTHLASSGNPGGCIETTMASGGGGLFQARTLLPSAPNHPWRGDFRALGVSSFSFDREVIQGSANFGTRPTIVLGHDNGTPTDVLDDTIVWVRTTDAFQFGASPWTTVATAIPSLSLTLPMGFGAAALPNSPNLTLADPDSWWNIVIQDVSYLGIAMDTPWNGAGWFGNHVIRFDNFVLDGAGVGTSYCAANNNTTGAPGVLSVFGNTVASANNMQLSASSLPANVFGFFLTSRTTGLVNNPGGSQGNLCLGGSIGRFVRPGQIQNAGASGAFSLPLDLTQMPLPTGLTPVLSGETWHFQSWYRDVVGGAPASNFTQGVSVAFS